MFVKNRDYTIHFGEKHSKLTIISFSETVNGKRCFLCKCDCGKEVSIRIDHVLYGNSKSCGCTRYEKHIIHGDAKANNHSRTYRIWNGMIQRCTNKKDPSFQHYGGKNVKVCDQWRQYPVFRKWAFENGYRDDLTIDRINSNKDYCPENCQWITRSENTIRAHEGKKHIKGDLYVKRSEQMGGNRAIGS